MVYKTALTFADDPDAAHIVEFGMNMHQAIEAPRWATRSFPSSPFPHTMYPGDLSLEGRIAETVRAELEQRGHKVSMKGPCR